MGPLSFYTVLCAQRLVELPQACFRSFTIRQNIEGLRRGNVRVPQNALNLFVVYPGFVQARSQPSTEGMPAEPRTVDVLRNVAPRHVVQVERA
jgi:hypothetical protein